MSEIMTELDQAVALARKLSPLDRVRLVEQVMATLESDLTETEQPKQSKRSLYGLWSEVHISAEDIDEARDEMWKGFPREDIE